MIPPKYSIIVPTYNRIAELQELLPSISNLDRIDHIELIIVDDGSTDNTASWVENYASSYPIHYIRQKNQGPGAARNLGMSIAKGTYFIFVDSDCILPPDYIYKIDTYLEQYHPDAFGGPDTYHPSFSPFLKAVNYSMTSFIGTGGTRGSKKSVTKFYPRSFNMGFHRDVFEKIGGFNALRHGQDMDYSARIYKAGYSVQLIPDAYVYHKRRTSIWKFFKQIHNWGVTRINLASLYPGMLRPIHLMPAILVLGVLVAIIVVPFTSYGNMILIMALSGIAMIAIIAFYQSYKMYASVKISLLSIITLYIQVGAYGLGLLNGMWQKWILRRDTAIGITKNYYK
ncbi:MAG: glycosyltransferase [Saprospiraceae bacterium]